MILLVGMQQIGIGWIQMDLYGKSEQNISPKLPTIYIQITKKPS